MKFNININTLTDSDLIRIHNTIYSKDKARLDKFLKSANISFKEFLSDVLDSIESQYNHNTKQHNKKEALCQTSK